MRLPRVRVRTLMVAVTIVALLLGGGREYLRLKRLSDRYKYMAWGQSWNVRHTHKRILKLQARLRTAQGDRAIHELYMSIEMLSGQLAAYTNIVQILEHAASHPWEAPPEIVEPADQGVERQPSVQRILTAPQTPEPDLPL